MPPSSTVLDFLTDRMNDCLNSMGYKNSGELHVKTATPSTIDPMELNVQSFLISLKGEKFTDLDMFSKSGLSLDSIRGCGFVAYSLTGWLVGGRSRAQDLRLERNLAVPVGGHQEQPESKLQSLHADCRAMRRTGRKPVAPIR